MQDVRSLVKIENNTIIIDEDKLDLFRYYDEPIPPWQPDNDIEPYSSLSILGCDIETLGLDPNTDRIVLIGLFNEKGDYRIIKDEDESIMLRRFIKILTDKKPDILTGYNCIEFDYKFIKRRCELHGVAHPFSIATRETTIRTAQRFGEPVRYFAVWVSWGYNHSKETAIIDLYHQVLQWDNVKRKLTKYTLKQCVLQMGLRKEARLELSYEEMIRCWRKRDSGGMDRLVEYLQYDLEDTKLLADYLLPSVYYQKLFLPTWKLQSISTSGNGSKWNDILTQQYPGVTPESQEKHLYEGGLTGAIAGFFMNVVKFDVASLYPSIMLNYGICTNKDTEKKMLSILKYMKDERIRLKHIKDDDTGLYGDSERAFADQMQGTMKIMINSCFTGDTLLYTDKGIKTLSEVHNKLIKVLNKNGEWENAIGTKHGKQKIWLVAFGDNKKNITVRTTASHRWFAAPYSRRTEGRSKKLRDHIPYDEMITSDLKVGMIVPRQFCPKPDSDNQEYRNGLVHGILYGDGTYHKYKNYTDRYSIAISNCKKELIRYFYQATNMRHISTLALKRDDLHCRISLQSYSTNFKSLPVFTGNNHSYLLGFIRGLISTDGNVSSRDAETSLSGRLETCNWIEKYAPLVGYEINGIVLNSLADEVNLKHPNKFIMKGYPTKQNHDNYHVKFNLLTVDDNDLLRYFHKRNYKRWINKRCYGRNKTFIIKSIVETDDYDDVYCVRAFSTNSFTLNKGIVTGNCYGSLSTQGIAYNDYVAAAMVTAYGRAILKLMVKSVEEYGGISISIDTDGVYAHIRPGKERDLHKYVQSKMPKDIVLEMELHAKAFYSPPSSCSDVDDDDEDIEGLRKNYIIFYNPKKDGTPGGYKATGKFRKRDKSKLEKTFTPEFLLKYMDAPESAESYYKEIIESLRDRTYPLKDICITRKIRVNERKLIEQGVGKAREQVTIVRVTDKQLYSEKTGKPLKAKEPVWRRVVDSEENLIVIDTDEDETELQYNPEPYIKMVLEQYQEIKHCLRRMR